jgi:hypothetical protein
MRWPTAGTSTTQGSPGGSRERRGPAPARAACRGGRSLLPDRQVPRAAAEAAFLDSVGTDGSYAFQLAGLADADLRRMAELVRRYADRRLGGTDASVIAMCERPAIITVATVNLRDFANVRPPITSPRSPQSRSTLRRTGAAPGLIPRASRRTAAERNNADLFGKTRSDRTCRNECVAYPMLIRQPVCR